MTTTELVPVEQVAPLTLFGTDDPIAIIASATDKANALAGVVRDKRLYSVIESKEYVRVEGWTLLGSMVGVFPVCVWTHKLEDGWEARVEARTLSDQVVGAAEAQCTRDEPNWKNRKEYALRSMAQTRATAKAMRLPLGFIMALAGYEATPAEEMQAEGPIEGVVIRRDPEPFEDGEPRSVAPHVEGKVVCRFCNGATYDNRTDKRNPNGPDYKCRDKECGGAAWIQEDGSLNWKQ